MVIRDFNAEICNNSTIAFCERNNFSSNRLQNPQKQPPEVFLKVSQNSQESICARAFF